MHRSSRLQVFASAVLTATAVAFFQVEAGLAEPAGEPAGALNQLPAPSQCVGTGVAGVSINEVGYSGCAASAEAGLRNAGKVVASPDGRHLYALSSRVYLTNTNDGLQQHPVFGGVAVLQRAGNGAITQVGRSLGAQFQNCISGDTAFEDIFRSGCDDSPRDVTTQLLAKSVDLDISPDGRFLYVLGHADLDSGPNSGIAIFERNSATGKLTPSGCFGSWDLRGCGSGRPSTWGEGEAPVAMTVSADGQQIYALFSTVRGSDYKQIIALDRNADSGALSLTHCYSGEANSNCRSVSELANDNGTAIDIATTKQGDSLYLLTRDRSPAGEDLPRIFQFSRAGDGQLTNQGCVVTKPGDPICKREERWPYLDSPTALTVSPDGKDVYVAYRSPIAIAAFQKGTGGALNWHSCAAYDLNAVILGQPCQSKLNGSQLSEVNNRTTFGGLEAIAVSPDGNSVYASGGGYRQLGGVETRQLFGALLGLARNADGSLSQYPANYGCSVDSSGAPISDRACRPAVGFLASEDLAVVDRNVYVTGKKSDSLAAFSVSNGTTSPGEPVPDQPQEQYYDLSPKSSRSKARREPQITEQKAASCQFKRLPAVSVWRSWKGVRARLRGPTGGYVSSAGARGRLRVEFSKAKAKARVRKVIFKLDGRKLQTARARKFEVLLSDKRNRKAKLSAGIHRLTAEVILKGGKRLKLTLQLRVPTCLPSSTTNKKSDKDELLRRGNEL